MQDASWAINVIQDLKRALDPDRYSVVRAHLTDAAAAIITIDAIEEAGAARTEPEPNAQGMGGTNLR